MKKFIDFIKAPGLFKIPYWIILLIGAIYFVFVMGYDEVENTLIQRIIAYFVVVLISFWMWKRKK